MTKAIPFISNTKDELHCLQATFMMILKYFSPDTVIDWNEWSSITGFEEDKGTWPIAGLVWFKEHGYTVKHVEAFDFEQFVKRGEAYLQEKYPGEEGAYVLAHTNIKAEQQRTRQLLDKDICENRTPTLEDIKNYLDLGYLVRVHVNSRKLNGKPGYYGHAVVVFAYDKEGFTLHDPGPPAMPNRKLSFSKFKEAWADPNASAAEMSAIRLES